MNVACQNCPARLLTEDKVIFNGKINSPDVFKVDVGKDNEILNIENIKFDDLEYDDVN